VKKESDGMGSPRAGSTSTSDAAGVDAGTTPFVSVVTPVYNGGDYLERCIESVLEQSYENFEYVIVDNCSTDATPDILRRFAAKDERIRVLTNQEFLTSIQNHNAAMRAISEASEFCKVVHADDWLFPNCIAEMVSLARQHPSVGVVCSYYLEGDVVCGDGLPYEREVVAGSEVCRDVLLGKLPFAIFGNPSSELIRSDLIRARPDFYAEKNPYVADKEACFDVLADSDLGFVHQVLSFNRYHGSSVSSTGARLNPWIAGHLRIVTHYGPNLLSESEYRRVLGGWLDTYYRYLGKAVYQLKPASFWQYHRAALDEMDSFRTTRIPLEAARFALAAAVNPGNALVGVASTAKRRLARQ
jgi:glycosyltransferase involved in cell wall biosynthesis